MTKVIFCTDGIFPHEIGGMQRHSRMLIEQLAARPDAELVVIHPHPEKIFDPALKITEEFVTPIDKRKTYLLQCYDYSKRVHEVILRYPDHIVYSQGLSVWYGIRNLKGRVIVNPHGLEPYQVISFRDRLTAVPFRLIFNYLFRHAEKVVSLGGKLTDILRRNIRDAKKIVELANAVSLPVKTEKTFPESGPLNLLFVARFAHNKGIHILIQAVEELNKEGYEEKLTFYLGGKGPLYDLYTQKHKFRNLNYLGFISDEQLFGLYASNHLFVFPTLFEGMPTVVLEAMSHQMPVVVSDVGATSVLVDSSNGFLIEKNSVSALKKAIVDFYRLDVAGKRRLAENSYRKVADRFTWEVIAQKHMEVFNGFVKK